jgi:hypothetical protein
VPEATPEATDALTQEPEATEVAMPADTLLPYQGYALTTQQAALSVARFCLVLPNLDHAQRQFLEEILIATGYSFSDLIYHADGTENMEASQRVEIKFRLHEL